MKTLALSILCFCVLLTTAQSFPTSSAAQNDPALPAQLDKSGITTLEKVLNQIDFNDQRYVDLERLLLHYQVFTDHTLVRQWATVNNDGCDPLQIDVRYPSSALLLVNDELVANSNGVFQLSLPDRMISEIELRFSKLNALRSGPATTQRSKEEWSIPQVSMLIEFMDSLDLSAIEKLEMTNIPAEVGSKGTNVYQWMYFEEGKLLMKQLSQVPLDKLPQVEVVLRERAKSVSARSDKPIYADKLQSALSGMTNAPVTKGVQYKQVHFDQGGVLLRATASNSLLWQALIGGLLAVVLCTWVGWLILKKVFG